MVHTTFSFAVHLLQPGSNFLPYFSAYPINPYFLEIRCTLSSNSHYSNYFQTALNFKKILAEDNFPLCNRAVKNKIKN